MEGRPHSETLTFESLTEARTFFDVLKDRDGDARPHIKALLFKADRLMFEISRTKMERQYRWEFVPA
jgi:hypothetical protein